MPTFARPVTNLSRQIRVKTLLFAKFRKLGRILWYGAQTQLAMASVTFGNEFG